MLTPNPAETIQGRPANGLRTSFSVWAKSFCDLNDLLACRNACIYHENACVCGFHSRGFKLQPSSIYGREQVFYFWAQVFDWILKSIFNDAPSILSVEASTQLGFAGFIINLHGAPHKYFIMSGKSFRAQQQVFS